MVKITIRYWAAAKEAAGIAEESLEAVTLRDALDAVVASRPRDSRLAAVLARSSFLVNADPVGKADKDSIVLGEGAVIEVLPPFAGGLRPHPTLGMQTVTDQLDPVAPDAPARYMG